MERQREETKVRQTTDTSPVHPTDPPSGVVVSGLWQNSDFVYLWVGQTISKLGSHVGSTAIGFAALLTLKATPAQLGLLEAVRSAPVLLFGLAAGVWVDRLRRRPILLLTDLARAVILLSIPIAAAFGALGMGQLYIVAVLMGLFTLFFDLADPAFLPTLVPREQLVDANSRIAASSSLAEIVGQSLGGLLVQWVTAPFALLLDAFSYLASAVSILLIRKREPPSTPPEERGSIREGILEGLRVISHSSLLRALAGCAVTTTFFGSFYGVLYTLFAVRILHITPLWVGISIAAGGVGSLLGALMAERVTRHFGMGRILIGSFLFAASLQVFFLLVGLPIPAAILCLILIQFFSDIAWSIFGVAEISLRQTLIPSGLLGRANASIHVLMHLAGLIGALTAGVLAMEVGTVRTLILAWLGMLCCVSWLVLSPLRTLNVPETGD